MTNEQAIEILKDMKGVFGPRSHNQYSLPAIELAIQALEKQIAKKPERTNRRSFTTYTCICGRLYWDYVDQYCGSCGQRLE